MPALERISQVKDRGGGSGREQKEFQIELEESSKA